MATVFEGIDAKLQAFIEAQRMFFVATAPLEAAGHVNVSPKGLDTLRVIDPATIAYLDYVGSGAETIAHLTENGRITIMFCAMAGPPRILRCHGRGRVAEPGSADYIRLRPLFPPFPDGRAIIIVSVERIADSCGYGVPLYEFQRERSQLADWADRKGPDGLQNYQAEKNARSLDGLPAVTWVKSAENV
jgi:hypothetical protein